MPVTEVMPIFDNVSITKNASIVLATPVHLGNSGPNTRYWMDLNASGGGNVVLTYQIGDTPDETFYTPSTATAVHTLFKSSIGTASRDRVGFAIRGTKWLKFKAKENNASPVDLSADLIIARES